MKKEILYIELDDVLADFQSGVDSYRRLVAAYESKEIPLLPGYIPQVDKMSMDVCDMRGSWAENSDVYDMMGFMPGAREGFKILSKQFDTYIITTLPSGCPHLWMHKSYWVERNLGPSAEKKLLLVQKKKPLYGHNVISSLKTKRAAGLKCTHIHFGNNQFPDWNAVMKWFGY